MLLGLIIQVGINPHKVGMVRVLSPKQGTHSNVPEQIIIHNRVCRLIHEISILVIQMLDVQMDINKTEMFNRLNHSL